MNKLSEFVVKETHKSLTLHDIYNHSFQLQNIVLIIFIEISKSRGTLRVPRAVGGEPQTSLRI